MVDSPLVRDWVKQRGHAASTKRTALNSFKRFLDRTGLTEDLLLEAAKDPKRIRRIADDWIDSEKRAGRRPAYALTVWYAVKSFLESAGAPVAYNPTLTPEEMEPADIASRRVPTQAELRRLVDVLSLRNRAIVLFLASSGVRIGVIGNGNEGGGHSDGLRLESLPDLDLKTGEFKAKPPLVVVPTRLSKNGRAYTTAITSEAAGVIETMLGQRIAAGEKLQPKTPLFVPEARGSDRDLRTSEGFRTLNRNYLSNMVAENFEKVAPKGIHWTAHSIRAWTSSRLESCESQGLISKTRREWYLGHALGSIDVRYNLSRPLSAEATEDLRSSYEKVEPFLEVIASEKHVRATEEAILLGIGLDEETIAEIQAGKIPPSRITEIVRSKLPPEEGHKRAEFKGAQAKARILEGWQIVTRFDGDVFILEQSVQSGPRQI